MSCMSKLDELPLRKRVGESQRELDPRVIMGTNMALNKGKLLDQVVDILKKYGEKADGEETIVEMYKQY